MLQYALVDCNNFYVSCERLFSPRLRGKPVVVLSNNDGCVISRSNEAKKLGVPMTAPEVVAGETLPLVLLSGGGGGAKLAGALSAVVTDRPVIVVTNTGDDFEHLGLLICPDTDSVMYAASGNIDAQKGWGRAGEADIFYKRNVVVRVVWFPNKRRQPETVPTNVKLVIL